MYIRIRRLDIETDARSKSSFVSPNDGWPASLALIALNEPVAAALFSRHKYTESLSVVGFAGFQLDLFAEMILRLVVFQGEFVARGFQRNAEVRLLVFEFQHSGKDWGRAGRRRKRGFLTSDRCGRFSSRLV